jgi:hypothetical protein
LIELSYTLDPSKSTGEKADAILGQMRREQAVKDLAKSNQWPIQMMMSPPTTTTATTTLEILRTIGFLYRREGKKFGHF